MILMEVSIYNMIAISLILLVSRRINSNTNNYSEIFNILNGINMSSAIIATAYALLGTASGSDDVQGIIMGSTMLSSLIVAIVVPICDEDKCSITTTPYEILIVGWIVLSGFIFALFASLFCATTTACCRYSMSLFWISVHTIPLLLLDSIAIIINNFSFHHNLTKVKENFQDIIIICHLMVFFQCYTSIKYYCTNTHNTTSLSSSSSSTNARTNVFSIGEWYILSTFIFFLLVDFLHYVSSSSSSSSSSMTTHWRTSHFVVAQSGMVGCILGSIIANTIKAFVCSGTSSRLRSTRCIVVLHFTIIILVTFGCIELTLHQQQQQQQHFQALCQPSSSSSSSACSNMTLIQSSLLTIQTNPYLPLHIKWIITFLLTPDNVDVLPLILSCHPHSNSNSTNISYNHTNNNGKNAILRGWWLIYWAIILLLTMPLAIMLAQYLLKHRRQQQQQQQQQQTTTTHTTPTTNTNIVTTGRKFFHFVAVLLFAPVTWYAPSMMTLSYAIAIVVVVLLESLRITTITCNSTTSDTSTNKNKRTTTATATNNNTHSLGINDFYIAFLDEKDCEGGSSLIITHVALIFGCALPQWIASSLSSSGNSNGILFILLAQIGVLVLGIGDAFGAIVGSSTFGRTKWPESKRTLEGSASMFVSMLFCVCSFFYFENSSSSSIQQPTTTTVVVVVVVLILLTLVEASTLQIDNLCLPLMGATVLLISEKYINP